MLRAVSTEVAGWREALSDRAVFLTLLVRAVLAGALVALGVLLSEHGALVVSAAAAAVVVLVSLGRLRWSGRP